MPSSAGKKKNRRCYERAMRPSPNPARWGSALVPCWFFFYGYADHRDLHSFPTRRSSDLGPEGPEEAGVVARVAGPVAILLDDEERSEERRVGKECRSRWSPYH